MSLTKTQRLDMAVGKALDILDGFSKYLDLLSILGPNDTPTKEMANIAETTNAAAEKLLESDPDLMAEILPSEILAALKAQISLTNGTSVTTSKENLQEPFIDHENNNTMVEQGGFESSNSTSQNKQNASVAAIQYLSCWISSYQDNHFNAMKQNWILACF